MDIFPKILKVKKNSTRQKLRYIFTLFFLLCIVFFNISCTSASSDPLEYRLFPFTAEVSVNYSEISFDAVFSFSAINENAERDFSIQINSSKNTNHLKISKEGEDIKILLGDTEYITLPYSFFEGLRLNSAADMLIPDTPIRSISSITGAECDLPQFESLTAVTTGDTIVYIAPESSLPVKIVNLKSGDHLMIKHLTIENNSEAN